MRLLTIDEEHHAVHSSLYALLHVPTMRVTQCHSMTWHLMQPRWYKYVYREWDTDCFIFAHWTIAWYVRLALHYRVWRYDVLYWLWARGIILVPEGIDLCRAKFNWDWRWYDKSTWGRHDRREAI